MLQEVYGGRMEYIESSCRLSQEDRVTDFAHLFCRFDLFNKYIAVMNLILMKLFSYAFYSIILKGHWK